MFSPINHIDMKTKIRDGINEIQDEMKRLVS